MRNGVARLNEDTAKGLLTFEESQIGIEVSQGYQMGGSLDPHDIDRHRVGDHRPVLPWPGV
jgi:hypothetical protein